MTKRTTLSAVIAVAIITGVPTVSEAGECSRVSRLETGAVAVVDGTKRAVRSAGDAIVRTSDRVAGWLFRRDRI
jgi:hypothetical protein